MIHTPFDVHPASDTHEHCNMLSAASMGAVILLISAAKSSTAGESAPNSLRYVIAFFRHGIRGPLVPTALPNDPNLEEYGELLYGEASLTRIGKQQMFSVGTSLRERYGSFIDGYQEDKVTVTSTNVSRTVMSALTVMAAMFPPSPRILRAFPWQPVPVWPGNYNFEKTYVFDKRIESDCPRYFNMSSESSLKFNSKDTREDKKRIYELVQQYAGDNNINTPSQLNDIYDTLYFAQRNHLLLPEWFTRSRGEFGHRPLFPDMLLQFYEEFHTSNTYYHNNEDMLRIFSGPLIHVITTKLREISSIPGSPGRLWYHSTHDTTIYALLRGLKVNDPLTVAPGGGVLVELHEGSNEKYVKIFSYNANDKRIDELDSPLCPNPCSLQTFSANLKGLNPEQWDKYCKQISNN